MTKPTASQYVILTNTGVLLAAEVPADLVAGRAQRFANERNESVRVAEDLGEAMGEEEVVQPQGERIDPDAQCAEHGCARWRCAEEHA